MELHQKTGVEKTEQSNYSQTKVRTKVRQITKIGRCETLRCGKLGFEITTLLPKFFLIITRLRLYLERKFKNSCYTSFKKSQKFRFYRQII